MAKRIIKAGNTSNILHVFISDSSSTTGAGLTGLLYNSAGLIANYMRPGDTVVTAITLASITTLGTYVSGGFKEINSTLRPGWYEFDPPDASCAAGAPSCSFHLQGATNMSPLPIEVQLDVNTAADIYARLGAPAGASVSADVAAIKTDTGNIYLDTHTNGVVIPQVQADKVWGTTTRLLTAGTNIVLAKGTGITGFNDIAATDVWGAVLPGTYGAGSAGYILGTNLNATVSSRSAPATAQTIDLTTTVPTFTGKPGTIGQLLYFIRQNAQNKLDFNKTLNNMILYEDDGITAKLTYAMTDNASDAIRGAGA